MAQENLGSGENKIDRREFVKESIRKSMGLLSFSIAGEVVLATDKILNGKEKKETNEGDPDKILNEVLVLIRENHLENWLQNESKASEALYHLRDYVAKGYENKELEKQNKEKQKELGGYLNSISDTKKIEVAFTQTKSKLDQLLGAMKESIGKEYDHNNKEIDVFGDEYNKRRGAHYEDILLSARRWRTKFGKIKALSTQWNEAAFKTRYDQLEDQIKSLEIKLGNTQRVLDRIQKTLDAEDFKKRSKEAKNRVKAGKEKQERLLEFNKSEIEGLKREREMVKEIEVFVNSTGVLSEVNTSIQQSENFIKARLDKSAKVLTLLYSGDTNKLRELKLVKY